MRKEVLWESRDLFDPEWFCIWLMRRNFQASEEKFPGEEKDQRCSAQLQASSDVCLSRSNDLTPANCVRLAAPPVSTFINTGLSRM